ncbi:hypothetical protein TNIN_492201 [Trichonephila inaurata madagascariensis]|uniref:Uncharacterized protein n=1 Tax=Trichonephila inaurata madagascariensis TaxID=2747483 RepID=A0A8X6IWY9_9ARAC|nr:hypothetical protein TNIN_492201 [Trichonephila inaurata madagascariensis]
MANGDLRDISLLGCVKIKNRECKAIPLTLRLGKTRSLGRSQLHWIHKHEHNFVLACLHPPRSPTREAVCRSSGKNQTRHLPGVHPEYSATASG